MANNFVLVSEYLYPCTSVISSKAENSIYCCLFDGKKQYENKRLLTYLLPFDRYVTYSDLYDKLSQKISEKHIYNLAYIKSDNNKELIYNKDFVEHQWNVHLNLVCPYAAIHTPVYNPRLNILLFDQFLMRYVAETNLDFSPVKDAKNAVIMVDNRKNIFSVISLYVTFTNLEKGKWSCVVVCNEDNKSFFQKYLGDNVEYITKFDYPTKKFAIEIYNDLLKSSNFWATFTKYEKVLFVQDDGMICKKGMENEFLKYDYVGAPWGRQWVSENPNKFIKENINKEMVGNGGVSLRSVKVMKDMCEKYKYLTKQLHYDKLQQQPEDVFFSYCCTKEKTEMPTYDEAQKFSSEQVIYNGSYGFHKTWVYHSLSSVETMFNAYLKTKLF
jgi:hypothetical protein